VAVDRRVASMLPHPTRRGPTTRSGLGEDYSSSPSYSKSV
jgi:hypothetical protein